jgi:hypothetical protein
VVVRGVGLGVLVVLLLKAFGRYHAGTTGGDLVLTLLSRKGGIGSVRYGMRTSMMAAMSTSGMTLVTMELGIVTA